MRVTSHIFVCVLLYLYLILSPLYLCYLVPASLLLSYALQCSALLCSALLSIGDYLDLRGYTHCRLDGSTHRVMREVLINQFNKPRSPYTVFCLSTRAGGEGACCLCVCLFVCVCLICAFVINHGACLEIFVLKWCAMRQSSFSY